jgi:hypothetical protein
VGVTPQPAGAGGNAVARTGEDGRARRFGARAIDKWGRAATGFDGSGGVRERVRESGEARRGVLTRGPGQHSDGRSLNSVQTDSKIFNGLKIDSKSYKLWLAQKLPSHTPKNWE